MKHIILHFDKAFFERLNQDKLRKQAILGYKLTWEEYIKKLFGLSGVKLVTSLKHLTE